MFRIITNVVYSCDTSATAARRRWSMPWLGSEVDENETLSLSCADLQRVGFHTGQEKKGNSTAS